MLRGDEYAAHGLRSLRVAVLRALDGLAPSPPGLVLAVPSAGGSTGGPSFVGALRSEAMNDDLPPPAGFGDAEQAISSEENRAEGDRLIALVELARGGDSDAFGLLYDHYQSSVYRFLYYRTRSVQVAEDLASETFFRALRSMNNFRWQGKDFGAWLMTIARNLATDHFKAGRTRLEMTTDDMGQHDNTTEGPETSVLANLTNEMLMQALSGLPEEQRDCLVMRFLQGMTIAETAAVLGRSDGAVKQLQLRGVRNLAKLMPEGIRE